LSWQAEAAAAAEDVLDPAALGLVSAMLPAAAVASSSSSSGGPMAVEWHASGGGIGFGPVAAERVARSPPSADYRLFADAPMPDVKEEEGGEEVEEPASPSPPREVELLGLPGAEDSPVAAEGVEEEEPMVEEAAAAEEEGEEKVEEPASGQEAAAEGPMQEDSGQEAGAAKEEVEETASGSAPAASGQNAPEHYSLFLGDDADQAHDMQRYGLTAVVFDMLRQFLR
jgi:hypothetical protein